MMRTILLLLLVLLSLSPLSAEARRQSHPDPHPADEQEVLKSFEQILDLWRDGRYAELYERTAGGREGKESFAKRLSSAPRRPACCWEKMQEARVTLKSDRAATVRAKLGFEGSISGTEFVTKPIKLKREDGVWQISQSDLFTLANLSKKRPRYKYLPPGPK